MLRAINIVTWRDEAEAHLLRSVEEVEEAAAAGQITVEEPGVVVNMPVVDRPSGGR